MAKGLPTKMVDIPLHGGVNEKPDPKLLGTPFLAKAENAIYRKAGALEKRNGYGALPTTGLSGSVHSLFKNGGALHAMSETAGLLRLSETNNQWTGPSSLGTGETHPIAPCEISVDDLHATTGNILVADVAINGNVACFVWIDNGVLYALLREVDTGVVISGPTELDPGVVWTAFSARVATAGNLFLVVASDGVSVLYGWTLDATSLPLTWSGVTTLLSAVGTMFDLAAGTASGFVLACSDGATNTLIRTYTAAGAAEYSVTLAQDSRGVVGIMQHSDADEIFICRATLTSGIRCDAYNSDLTTLTGTSGTTNIYIAPGAGAFQRVTIVEHELTANAIRFFGESIATATQTTGLGGSGFTAAGGGLAASFFTVGSMSMRSKAWIHNGETYIVADHFPEAESVQPQMLLLRMYGPDVVNERSFAAVARFLVDRSTDSGLKNDHSSVGVTAGGGYLFAARGFAGALTTVAMSAVTIDLSPPPARSVEYGGNTYLSGGMLWSYDGQIPAEATPHWAPRAVEATLAGSGGSIDAGAHSWVVVWEWEDARGVLHRSAPSVATAATAAANDSATLVFDDLSVRARDGLSSLDVRAALYRTKVGGSSFFLVKRQTPAAATPAGEVQLTDTAADAALGASLYTDGGILSAEAVGPVQDLVLAKDRLFVLDGEDRTKVRYSKYLSPTVAPEFNGALFLTIPRGEGVALGAMDQAILAFTSTEVFAFFGDGPTDAGAQDNFSRAQDVSSPDGCIDRNSVVKGPFGVTFRGRRGIYAVNRSLQVEYIGAAVEDSLGSNTILRATVVDEANEVRFLLDNGTVLVWNYLFKAWTTWTQHTSATDALLYEQKYTYGTSTPAAFQDDGGYLDPADAYIPLHIQTSWIHVAGHQGFQRARHWLMLATDHESFQLLVKLGYNYEDTLTLVDKDGDGRTFAGNFTPQVPWQRSVRVIRQKSQSIRLDIVDADPSNGGEYIYPGGWDGQGYSLQMLSLEIGIKRGRFKLPATKRE